MVQKRKLALNGMELAMLVYGLITTIMILIYWNNLNQALEKIELRGILFTWIAVGAFVIPKIKIHEKIKAGLRTFPYMIALIWLYPETYDFCSQFPYLDHVFAEIDRTLFGCQPALLFDKLMPETFWSEAFCMGYYAYYYLMAAVILFYLLCRYQQFDKACFIFLGTFFMFYLVYDFLPVAGPQYYFCALQELGINYDNITEYPALGDYFKTHTNMIAPEVKGIFSQLVTHAHEVGERPTAAFPSSHVGMSTISMILAWKSNNKWLFWILMPIFILLCCGTVYIKAHYLIDSISGFIIAFIFYYAIRWVGKKIY